MVLVNSSEIKCTSSNFLVAHTYLKLSKTNVVFCRKIIMTFR